MSLNKAPGSKSGKSAAEVFFEKNLSIAILSEKDFILRMKLHDPQLTDAEISEVQGYNFDENGKTIIVIRGDAYPKKYIPYIETHEKWEAYIARKSGYNLYQKAIRKYREDRNVDVWSKERKEAFFNTIKDFNYEFRHEYAIYKEYEHALNDGCLEEWHRYYLNNEEKLMRDDPEGNVPVWLKNDMQIRKSIFEKLTEGAKHSFLRAS